MTKITTRLVPFLLATLPCCAVPHPSGEMWRDLRITGFEFDGRAELRGPITLGIAPPLRTQGKRWGTGAPYIEAWTDEEREVVDRWAEKFKAKGLVERVVYLPRLLIKADDAGDPLAALRSAGRSAGVDAVLVTHSLTEFGEQMNLAAVFDLTIVGMWLFPGHCGKAVTVAEAVVFQPATNRLIAMADGQGEATATTPLAYVDERELARQAQVRSLDELGRALFEDIELVGMEARSQ